MQACEENLAFKFLSGMEQPGYKAFLGFLERHREDLPEVFFETVKLAREMGLVKFAHIALDGSKIKANTSKHKAMSYGRMSEEEKRIKEEIKGLLEKTKQADAEDDRIYGTENDGYHLAEELAHREDRLKKIEAAKAALEQRENKEHPGKPIDSKKQISFADPEARCFSKKGNGTEYVYNGQVAVDMESQIIVENHIEDSVSDAQAVSPALKNMEEGLGEKPEKLVMDGGYGNKDTLEVCQEHQVTPVCATSREEEKPEGSGGNEVKGMNSFSYDSGENTFRCPHGAVFVFDHWRSDGTVAVYHCQGNLRCSCGRMSQRKGGSTLWVRKCHLARRELQRIMGAHRGLYRRRKCTVEPVIGQIKKVMGFRQFLRQGLKKVSGEWNLVCAAFNVKKIAALMRMKTFPGPRPAGEILFPHQLAHCIHLFESLISLMNLRIVPLVRCA